MPALPAAAQRPIRQDGDVPDLAGQTLVPEQQAAVFDDASANAGADGDVDQMLVSASRAKFPLAQGSHVGIVAQQGGHLEAVVNDLRQRQIGPSGDIGRGIDDARPRVGRPGSGHANGRALCHRPARWLRCRSIRRSIGDLILGPGGDALLGDGLCYHSQDTALRAAESRQCRRQYRYPYAQNYSIICVKQIDADDRFAVR